ncbi:MAG: hypothetical protein WC522_07510 [Candidatus Omnitrophota bacterium]
MGKEVIGFEEVTVDDTVKVLTASIYAPAQGRQASRAMITVEGGNIRYRVDGGNPTSASGHLATEGDIFALESIYEIKNFKATRVSTASGKLVVSYEE